LKNENGENGAEQETIQFVLIVAILVTKNVLRLSVT